MTSTERPYTGRKAYTHPKKGKGRGFQWLKEHVGYSDEDCLTWPFGLCNGYGLLGHDGKVCYAHRVMCELVNGPSPGTGYHAAHSCGRGDQACVHPRHVSWKTISENQLDRTPHGTRNTGKRGKVSRQQQKEILALRGKLKQREIAEKYGITRSRVGIIQTNLLRASNG